MRLRLREGVKAEDEPPPETIPIKGAMLASSVNHRNRSPSNERRSRSHRRVFRQIQFLINYSGRIKASNDCCCIYETYFILGIGKES